MVCYLCGRGAIGRCVQCGRPYCEAHRLAPETICAACGDPERGLPSPVVYTGSLLALMVAAAVALWLLVSPPGLPSSGEVGPLPQVRGEAITAPLASASPPPSPSPSFSPTPSPTPAFREYVVQEGDTLYRIAQLFLSPGADLLEFAQRIAQLNGLSDSDYLVPGQVIQIPEGP